MADDATWTDLEKLCSGPYRFVEIAEDVVLAPEAVRRAQNERPLKGGFSGVITVEWAVETPLLIGDYQGQDPDKIAVPFKIGEDWFIPGATLRGAMRAAMEIVCRARLTQINKHHWYGVRDFHHPVFAADQDGERRLSWGKLGAGWLRKAVAGDPEKKEGDSDYVVTPCDKRLIRIRSLPFNRGASTECGRWHRKWLCTPLLDRYDMAGMLVTKEKREKDAKIINFCKASYFAPAPDQEEDYVIPAEDGAGRLGVFVFSGHSPTVPGDHKPETERLECEQKLDAEDRDEGKKKGRQKKREYVFLDRNDARPVRLKQDVFDRFELLHSKPSKNKPTPDGSYKHIEPTLQSVERVPIFFTGELDEQQRNLQIGLTRLFKLRHSYAVKDKLELLSQHQINLKRPDIVEALFGYVFEEKEVPPRDDNEDPRESPLARKGRVSFGFARLMNRNDAQETDEVLAVMTGPRASFGPFYLRGPEKDWSNTDARLAGRKRYFPRFPRQGEALAGASETIKQSLQATLNQSGDMISRMQLLKARTRGGELIFQGDIRVRNVLAEEIGALLWALTHGCLTDEGDLRKPYRHMLGRAKTFGAGQTRVKSVALTLEAHDEEARALLRQPEEWETGHAGAEGWTDREKQSLTPFLRRFDAYMARACGGWPDVRDIREFLGVSRPDYGAQIVKDQKVAYPQLREFKKLRKTYADAPDRYLPAPAVESNSLANRPYRNK